MRFLTNLYEQLVFVLLLLVGSFQLLISLWHINETYYFESHLSSFFIFLIMLLGLINIMNGYSFANRKTKVGLLLLCAGVVGYVALVGSYISIAFEEVAHVESVAWTFGLKRSIGIMMGAGVLALGASLVALQQVVRLKK